MDRVFNATPHDVVVRIEAIKDTVKFEKSTDLTLRCDWESGGEAESTFGIKVLKNGPYSLTAPPDFKFKDGDVIITSQIVGNAVEAMTPQDFSVIFQGKKVRIVSPGSGPDQAERTKEGQIKESFLLIEYLPSQNEDNRVITKRIRTESK